MPVCPNCNYEYVEGVTICPDCNVKLVDEIDLKEYEKLSEKDWVLIYTSFDEFEIEMIKDNLESSGIEASVFSQKDRSFPVPGDLSPVKLFVRKSDLQPALNFVEELLRQSGNNNISEDE
jgi:hypothetical protein